MNNSLLPLLLFSLFTGYLNAQTPILDSWTMNQSGNIAKYYTTTGSITSTGVSADVTQLCYTADSVWIKTSGMPSIFGPWKNPGSPTNQNFTFRFPRNPAAAANPVKVPIVFVTGVLINGAPIFGTGDARSYKSSTNSNVNNGDGLWNGNAYYTEGKTLDTTYAGHVNQDGTYHSHATPFKIYKSYPTNVHSPLVGFAFDGYPVYGPYGYSTATNSSSSVKRISSSYRLRNITSRTTLPNGTTSNPAGPAVSTTFPLGMYIEDYEYVNGLGDLDEHNGRMCVTPEYPNGTYAYFVTIDASGNPAYPFYIGSTYYGKADQGNLTPKSTIKMPSNVTGCMTLGVRESFDYKFQLSPNPVHNEMVIEIDPAQGKSEYEITIINSLGKVVFKNTQTVNASLELSDLENGIYFISFYNSSTGQSETQKFIKQ